MACKGIKELNYRNFGHYCQLCGKKFNAKNLTAHHVIEKSQGGTDNYGNIAIVCEKCHFKVINYVRYNSKEYKDLMNKIRKWRTEHIDTSQ